MLLKVRISGGSKECRASKAIYQKLNEENKLVENKNSQVYAAKNELPSTQIGPLIELGFWI